MSPLPLQNHPMPHGVKSAFWLQVLTVVAVPLVLAPGLHFLEITPKLLVLVAGACLVWLVLAAAKPVVVGEDPPAEAFSAGRPGVRGACRSHLWFRPIPRVRSLDPEPELYRSGEGQWQTVRPPSTLGHANYFAVVTLLALFCAAVLALSASTTLARLGWAVGAVMLMMALVISGSRAAWLLPATAFIGPNIPAIQSWTWARPAPLMNGA